MGPQGPSGAQGPQGDIGPSGATGPQGPAGTSASGMFPSANVVFVDSNYLALQSAGLLAYGTIEDALVAWRTGGSAETTYGAPSSSNPGLILVGVGIFAGTAVNVDVDYINIQGISKEKSIISAASSADMITVTQPHVNIENITLDGGAGANSQLQINVASFVGNIDNIIFSGPTSVNLLIFSDCNNFDGIISNCIFEATNQNLEILATVGSSIYGKIVDCTFKSSTSADNIYIGSPFYGKIINCTFLACGRNSIYVDAGAEGSFHGNLSNCYILATASNASAIHLEDTSSDGIISFSRILGNGFGVAIDATVGMTLEVTHCTLRIPTSGSAGDSISTNITNSVFVPLNSELGPTTLR
jgi:hypothetical protein